MRDTEIQTNDPIFDDFYPRIKKFLQADVSEFLLDGKLVHGYRSPDSKPIWLRDHTLMMCGYKYFEPDMTSAVEHFAEMQAANGRLFDYFVIGEERENWAKYVRVPVEADVEYYLPMAVHAAWQATGDDEWLNRMLPHGERALQYTMTHPWRWSSEYHLVKRAYTIDTWDFDYVAGRTPWLNFQIDDKTHFGIFHGDNSGFYDACNKLSFLFGHLGDHTKKAYWHAIAEGVQERANQVCWNGRFYTHRMPLDDFRIPGVDELAQLSLSNPYDINRGLPTHEMAVEIIKEYQRRRESTNAFAEWFSIDPPFPAGIFGDDKLVPGAYVNGGIMPLVGGELARAAFAHGFEAYGLDILLRYEKMIRETGETYLWYFPDGRPSTKETSTSPEARPTDGWGSSAMLGAFMEGLCGIEDQHKLFEIVELSPRWAITTLQRAAVEVAYGASGAGIGYDWQLRDDGCLLTIRAKQAHIDLLLLLPTGKRVAHVLVGERAIPFTQSAVESSNYIDAAIKVEDKVELIIRFVE
jgi:hypothetical protein